MSCPKGMVPELFLSEMGIPNKHCGLKWGGGYGLPSDQKLDNCLLLPSNKIDIPPLFFKQNRYKREKEEKPGLKMGMNFES